MALLLWQTQRRPFRFAAERFAILISQGITFCMIISLGTTPAVQRVMRFPQLVLGQVNRASEVRECSAGKCVNVAKVLHQLHVPALAISFLGGQTGELIRQELDRMAVPTKMVEVVSPTRVCTTAIDQSAGTVTEFVEEPGPVSGEEYARLIAHFEAALPEAKLLILTGSLAGGVPLDLYARCAEAANRRGIPVLIDAQGEPLRRALPMRPLLVKPNRSELEATTSIHIDSVAALRAGIQRLLEAGPQWAAVTMGSQGVVVSDGRQFWQIRPPRVQAINPIGSGDAFAAGLAASLLAGQTLPQAALLATACGAANALQLLPGTIDPIDVARLQDQIRVEPF